MHINTSSKSGNKHTNPYSVTMTSTEYHYPVVGRKATGGVFYRLPIETLQKDHPYQFALFILAFIAIQQRPDAPQAVKQAAATFSEIASIHGKPYTEWAGDRNKDTSADYSATDKKDTNPVPSRFGGYCNHGAVVFPTWHRPYVMLIEQAIGNIAEKLAQDIEANNPGENGVWTRAAKELRFPYWDWADARVAEDGLPPVLYEAKVEIMGARGRTQTVDNPLSFFTFVGGIPSDFTDETNSSTGQVAYFSKWRRTYRYAASTPDPSGSQIDLLQKALKDEAKDLRARVAQLFAVNNGQDPAIAWDEFSNHTAESKRDMDFTNADSLEGVHDTVHLTLGGNGHMSDPDYAGFDPIFFLHHTNVDRLLALWEWCYTEYWMEDGYTKDGEAYPWTQERGTYAQVYNEQLLPDGPLQPFRTEKGEYWTSTETRFLHAKAYPKYYSYPALAGVKVDQVPTSSSQRAMARKRIAAFYGLDPRTTAKHVASDPNWRNLPVPQKGDPSVPADHSVVPNYRTFAVHVKLPEQAYNRSYSFQLHHQGNAHSSPQLVGTISVFARPDHSPCKACALRRQAGSVIRGMIPVPPELVDSIIKSASGQSPPTFDETLARMKGEFTGKLVDANGTELARADGGVDTPKVPQDRVASNRVTPAEISLVSTAIAEHTEHEDLPVHLIDWQHHDGIFNGGWMATHHDSR